jgi:4-amino-4-deoxy-L-arabinose transferase-like glycosyltransferase
MTHDEHEYLTLARNLNAGRGFTYDPPAPGEPDGEHFGRAPVYPLFLAAVLRLTGDDGHHEQAPASVKIAQAFVGAGTVLLIAAIGRRAAGARSGIMAAWIAALYPPLVFIGGYVLSESLFAALALASVLVLQIADANRRAGHPPPPRLRRGLAEARLEYMERAKAGARPLRTSIVTAAGALAGLAALTRPVMLVFIALAAMHLLRKRKALAAASFALAALIAIVPWTLHNLRTYDRFVLIASEGGITFWTGNHPLARGEGDMAANPALKIANRELRLKHAGLTPEQLEPVYYREAFAAIRERPVRWIGLLARKVFYFWIPVGPSYTLHSLRYRLATTVPYLILLPFAVLGAVGLSRLHSSPDALFLLALSSFIAAIVFFPQERFRIPILDPALVVCAAAWFGVRPWIFEKSGSDPELA